MFPSSLPTSADKPTVTWTGASGTAYEFQLDPIGSVYHPYAGVYIFCKPVNATHWQAVYIGESDSFQRRLTDELQRHHKWQGVLFHGATHICTLRVFGDLSVREGIETDLRRAIPTACNDQ
jgi:hypothetical protein